MDYNGSVNDKNHKESLVFLHVLTELTGKFGLITSFCTNIQILKDIIKDNISNLERNLLNL